MIKYSAVLILILFTCFSATAEQTINFNKLIDQHMEMVSKNREAFHKQMKELREEEYKPKKDKPYDTFREALLELKKTDNELLKAKFLKTLFESQKAGLAYNIKSDDGTFYDAKALKKDLIFCKEQLLRIDNFLLEASNPKK